MTVFTNQSKVLTFPLSETRAERVRLDDVTKTYVTDGQPVHALNGVSLPVRQGEFVALVGRSGCGKSTLLNLAGAMDFPSSGRVVLDGSFTSELNDNALTRLRRVKVGFIFQSFQLLNTLSVLETVELPLPLAGESLARDRACPTSSPADRCSVSPSRAPWCTAPDCCWRMNRPAISTRLPETSSSSCCGASRRTRTPPLSWRRTAWRLPVLRTRW